MPRCIRTWLAWLLPAVLLLIASPASADAPRLALVVGNAAYPARPLATAVNDAALVAQALAQAGFDVTASRDLDASRLRAALAGFVDAARAAGPDATLFVYLAGYGVQYDGGNYLVPVDARLLHDDDVPAETASLDDLVRALAAVPAKARLVIVDASRAQPFATVDEMPLAPGLAATNAPAGTIVAFAAAPGMVSQDDALPYGAYARALAETIAAPGLSPNVLLDRVRLRVGMLTNGGQMPWDDGSLPDDAALTPAVAPAPAAPIPQPPGGGLSLDTAFSVVIARDSLASYAEFLRIVPNGPLATRIRVLQALRREATIWQAAAASDDPRADWTYMARYPRGPHRFDARRRLAALHAALEPPPRFDPFVFPALPPPTPAELPLVASPEQALRGLPPIPPPPAALLPPADPAYYDELPMPSPAPAGLLPIAPPLPGAAGGEPGRIRQAPAGRAETVSETQLAPNGSASITLADATGPIAEVLVSEAGDSRTLVETGSPPAEAAPEKSAPGGKPPAQMPPPKVGPPVLSRTIVARSATGVTITQADGAGVGLLEIATTADADGGRTVRVTNGRDETLASWRHDAQGIVVAGEVTPSVGLAAPPTVAPPASTPPPTPTMVAPGPATPSPAPPRAPLPASQSLAPSIPVAPAAPPRSTAPLAPQAPLSVGPRPPASATSPVLPKLAPPASEPPLAAPPAAALVVSPSKIPLPPPRPVLAKPSLRRSQAAPGKSAVKPKPSAAKLVVKSATKSAAKPTPKKAAAPRRRR